MIKYVDIPSNFESCEGSFDLIGNELSFFCEATVDQNVPGKYISKCLEGVKRYS